MDKQFPVIDGHCDTALLFDSKEYDFFGQNKKGHIDFNRLKQADVRLQFFAVFVDPQLHQFNVLEKGLQKVNQILNVAESHDDIFLVREKNDLNKLQKEKLGILISVEGGDVLGQNIEMLDIFYRLGMRSLTLTWSNNNYIADGIADKRNGGLTNFGIEVIERMEEKNIILDVSHLSVAGFWDVVNCYKKPIIASHSNCKTVYNHKRSLDDKQIKAIAECNGLVGVNFAPHQLSVAENADLDTIIQHIKYLKKVVGTKYIALGSDFDGVSQLPKGINDVCSFDDLFLKMQKHKFTDKEIEDISYNNYYSFLKSNL
ncbi:dipeptidase [Proteinivorax hydrogeniformans]|uniref:Dipeptidase n=1 Tax=Proteinivorax hydrogeniformans TaxID=1826727 RepID=A0AAU8HX22_9FIRM